VLGFAVAIALGTVALMLPVATRDGQGLSLVDALFTATSAVCVTGLVVVNTASHFTPFGQVVILVLIQVGALGIMTMSTFLAVLVGKRISLRERLVLQEATGSLSLAGLVRLTRTIALVALTIEAAGALVLTGRFARTYPLPEALYLGVFHSVSAFGNAGFDLFSASLQGYATDALVVGVVTALVVIGGLGVYVLLDLFPLRPFRRLGLHTRLVLVVTGVLLAMGVAAILLFEATNPRTLGALPWGDRLVNSLLLSATPRTAGFSTVPVAEMEPVTRFLVMILMFVGGSPGSTAGGIKTTTLATLVLAVRAAATRRTEVCCFERRFPREVVEKALAIFAMGAGLVALSTMALLITEQAPLGDVLFEAVSAFGTVGLSTGLTSELSAAGRLVVAATMFVGRIGPLTLAIAIAQRRPVNAVVAYPEERVMVG